jgi:hypothetical protein
MHISIECMYVQPCNQRQNFSGGVGELGPHIAGDWGEDPQRQDCNEAEMCVQGSRF